MRQRQKDALTEGGIMAILVLLFAIPGLLADDGDIKFILLSVAGFIAVVIPIAIWRILTGRDSFV